MSEKPSGSPQILLYRESQVLRGSMRRQYLPGLRRSFAASWALRSRTGRLMAATTPRNSLTSSWNSRANGGRFCCCCN
uniref:Uncharacterized protein n=1 Tax=Trichogramma kaykai TaxID=54128 RepID=A0ABD2W0D7_9HYME